VRFEILTRLDVYSGAPQQSSAAQFGTMGITFRARRPAGPDEGAPEGVLSAPAASGSRG
jgi:hypothetical protein